ncbi:MAG: hypothetical protein PHF14_11980, partial [Verrucomicrobiota bacterium]|nr:hypothetical protein [Verrucomicrobiota bacterium]
MEPTRLHWQVENATAPSAGGSPDPDGKADAFSDDLWLWVNVNDTDSPLFTARPLPPVAVPDADHFWVEELLEWGLTAVVPSHHLLFGGDQRLGGYIFRVTDCCLAFGGARACPGTDDLGFNGSSLCDRGACNPDCISAGKQG